MLMLTRTRTRTRSLAALAAPPTRPLTTAQVSQFNRDGYLVLPGHLGAAAVAGLRADMEQLLSSVVPEAVSVFSTKEQTRTSDEYFLSSGDKVRLFFEERAFDTAGKLTVPVPKAINKVGHALHDLRAPFTEVSYSPSVASMLRALGYVKPMAVQSMYIFKQPGIGGEVGAHQDGTFLYTVPQSVVGFWWALEACDTTNGCLWAVPGSHKTVPISRWFKRSPSGVGTVFEPETASPYDLAGAVPLIIPAGSLVILHHALVHYSEENLSPKSRHAYSIHVVEGGAGTRYPAENWLQTETQFNCVYDKSLSLEKAHQLPTDY